jgi:histidinol-phosphate phosphatase family protein
MALEEKRMNKAVFLDRDGTINETIAVPDLGILESPLVPEQFKLLPNVPEAIRIFNRLGLKVIVASNQPAVAKGKLARSIFEAIREKMIADLRKENAHIDADYYCFHTSLDNCNCRKPKPGLLLQAAKDFNLDLSKSYLVGDSLVDIKAGTSVHCRTYLIGILKCDICKLMEKDGFRPDMIVSCLLEAAKMIERDMEKM